MTDITNSVVRQYLNAEPGDHSAIRSVLLFGKNTATYKFALCHALLQLPGQSELKYEDILPHFIDALKDHVATHPSQETRREPGKLVKACADANAGVIDRARLMKVADQVVPLYVFDAFQNIGNGGLDSEYRLFEHISSERKIVVMDTLVSITEDPTLRQVLQDENESRWRIVEEAWRIGISPTLVTYDPETKLLVEGTGNRRVNLRSAVDTLLIYQKGRCFYCSRAINRLSLNGADDFPDVDHFLPISVLNRLIAHGELPNLNPNAIWNLVISCLACNRGKDGKFDRIAHDTFLEKLTNRNERCAQEHSHALKNAILWSLNVPRSDGVADAMNAIWARMPPTHRWRPQEIIKPVVGK